MKILFAASEGVPFCKTGGLADVVGALPEALAAKQHAVTVVLPFYRQIRERFPNIKKLGNPVRVPIGGGTETVQIWREKIRTNLTFLFADAPRYFDRPGLYGETAATVYPDNDRRYAFYARAVLEIAKAVDFKPAVLHAHDWQAGLTPAYLKLVYAKDSFFSKTASLFTIHNMAYQGNFPPASLAMTGLPLSVFNVKGVEFYGQVSFFKAGLVYADVINTVSPTYAKEVQSDSRFGAGMEGILRERAADFEGIVNGIDVRYWDPKSDKLLAANFDEKSLDMRARCKADLQKESGLTRDPTLPLLSFIGRMDPQKGVDILTQVAPVLLKEGVQMVFLGQGHPQYLKALQELAQLFPAQVFVKTDFAEGYAHKIYAGSDIFLMPSRYEPCGLGQLIAMRYGAIPVVTPTGGLLDTVRNLNGNGDGTGFIADELTAGAFLSSVIKALSLFKDPKKWHPLQVQAMRQDYSWKKSVKDYLLLYESVLRK